MRIFTKTINYSPAQYPQVAKNLQCFDCDWPHHNKNKIYYTFFWQCTAVWHDPKNVFDLKLFDLSNFLILELFIILFRNFLDARSVYVYMMQVLSTDCPITIVY